MQEVILQNNFIGAWFLDDLSICDRLIDYYECVKYREEEGSTSSGIQYDLKKCKEIFFNYNEPIMIEYGNCLQKVCDRYTEKYKFSNSNSPWNTKERVKIKKYEPSEGYFVWHCERDSIKNQIVDRHLAYMTYLNDVSDGGETEFFYQNLKVRPQKGLTLIWPVDWTHTHRSITSMTQTKYIINGWFHYI